MIVFYIVVDVVSVVYWGEKVIIFQKIALAKSTLTQLQKRSSVLTTIRLHDATIYILC